MCVLGGTGFLGVHVVEAARSVGFHAVVLARGARDLGADERALDALDLDALDLDALEQALGHFAPCAVVNCAALARIADCDRDPERANALNADVPAFLARASAERGFRLVHVSTDLVFGARAAPSAGFCESDEPAPTSVYGATKLAGERAVLHANPNALVIRLPLLCGDSRGRSLGASDSVIAAVSRDERPRLFIDEWRTPLDVLDAARAIVALIGAEVAGVLHVAGPERMTRYELGLRALRSVGHTRPEKLVDAVGRAGDHAQRPADVALDAARARMRIRMLLRAPFVAFATQPAP